MSSMGLLECPASFQMLMEKFMDKIENVSVYVDDVLIHSQIHEQHLNTLELVMHGLDENHKKIDISNVYSASQRSAI
jgi:hypothetical protein